MGSTLSTPVKNPKARVKEVQSERPLMYLIKVVLIGDSGVGKTCILDRFADDIFTRIDHETTQGVDFKIKCIEVDDTPTKLQIWDTAGQERYRTITTSYFRGAHGFLLVYDVTEPKSLLSIHNWLKQIDVKSNEHVSKILVGSKCDCAENERKVSRGEGERIAREYSLEFFEVSAKTNVDIDKAFYLITRLAVHGLRKDDAGKAPSRPPPPPSSRLRDQDESLRAMKARRPAMVRKEDVDDCKRCELDFSVFRWKHNCRKCGCVVCHDCSAVFVALPELGYGESSPQRVCIQCRPLGELRRLSTDDDHTESYNQRALNSLYRDPPFKERLVLEHENWQSGTFSVVHKAMWTTGGTKRSVAVKMYRSHAVTEAMNSPAFTEIGHLRDIEAMGSHPNLVNFVYTNLERAAAPIADGTGFGSSSGECPVYACLMTELEPLGTLLAALEGAGQDKLDKHSLVPSSSQSSSSTTSVITLPWLLRLKVAHDVAKALAWLHEHLEILHFDVKAENVLLCSFDPKSPGPKAKLFDLTSAKSKSERWTSKHAPNTTPSHAAPEVFALADKVSTSRLFNEAVDVFAFGILCAELILGGSGAAFASYPPTSTALEMGEHVRKGCRPDLSPAEATVLCDPTPGTPHGFLNLARHCWAHLPDERPSVPQICSCLAALVLFNTPEEIENSGAGDGGGCSAEDGRVVEKLTSAIDKIDHLSFRIDDLTSKLDTVQDTLLRGVFEASQLHVPSCFVVVSERLKPHSSYAPTTTSTAVSAVASASASAGSNSSLSGLEEQLNWSEKLIGVVASVWRGKGSLQSARETVASFATKKVYLYLVDELTFRPIVLPETNAGGIWAPSKILSSKRNGGGVYPIKISQPAEVLKRLLPVLTLAIGAAALLDGTLALAQLFGLPPHARLPKWWLNSASKAAKWIREGPISSEALAQLVEDSTTATQLFLNADGDGEDEKKAEKEEELHFSPGDGSGSSPLPSRGVGVQKAKGEAFRALEELIHSADPDRTYCGLERKITRDGRVVFALPASLSASGALLVL